MLTDINEINWNPLYTLQNANDALIFIKEKLHEKESKDEIAHG